MTISIEQTTRVSTIFLCAVGLSVATFTGCDKPSGDQSAEAEKPSAPQGNKAPSEGNKAPAEGSPEPSGDKPTPPGGEQGSAGKPSPSAGGAGTNDKPEGMKKKPTAKKGGGEISDAELKKFIEVTETLRPKKKKLKKALDEASNPSEAKKAQKKVMKATRQAASDAGLEFSRFRTISRRAKTDRELQKRLKKIAVEQKVQEKK